MWADANTAIVGGPGNRDFEPNGAVGGAWVFTQSGGTWSQQATLVGSDAFGTSGQGFSVALSANGNTAIIGGPYDNGYTGAAWVFVQPPSVAEVVPAGGPPSGGTAVTITGTGFIDATAVNFGSASAASFAINSGTSITATSPAGTGAVDVTVTSPVGVSTTSPAGQYTYFYTIAVSAAPAADGTVEGGGDYTAGSVQTVTAVPNSGYAFVNWTQNGAVVSTSPSYTFTLNSSVSLVANFSIGDYTISVTASPATGGTVSGGGTFQAGSSQTVMATPNAGYAFINWTRNGSVVSTSASYTFTLTSNVTLVANFVQTYTISVSASPAAGGTVSGGGTFPTGSSQTVTATANSGYAFVNWTQSGSIVSISASCTFTLTSNVTLVANFVQTYTISAAAPQGAGRSVRAAAQAVPSGRPGEARSPGA